MANSTVVLHADCFATKILVTGPSNVLYNLILLEPGGGTQTLSTYLPANFPMNGAGQYTLIDDTQNPSTYFADLKINVPTNCINPASGSGSFITSTVDCAKGEIIVESNHNLAATLGNMIVFNVYYPDGSFLTMNNTSPFSFNFTLPGIYIITAIPHVFAQSGGWIPNVNTVDVNCTSTPGTVTPCDSISDVTSCVLNLNERYESLECVNDKKAEEEKIKLERAIQLLSLAKYDCECGKGYVYRYINEINNIANCDNCEKDYSAVVDEGYGCTDSAAVNYDSSATQDDGSCLYTQNCVSTTMPNRAPWNGASQTETLVPDPLFESFLELQGLGNGALDGKVCTVNINQSKRFECSDFIINDATGIGDMVNFPVETLVFDRNNLSTIDISQNIDLTNLIINRNNFTSLDISKNTKLTDIHLFSNNLYALDTSNNVLLINIFLTNNRLLSSLDLTNNINLTRLSAAFCGLTSLDISMCTNLTKLHLNSNPNLATLNLGSSIDLSVLMAGTEPGRIWNSNFRIESCNFNLNIRVGTAARVTQVTTLLNDLLTNANSPRGAFSGYTITT